MFIAVIHDDDTENEFDVELCCPDCARASYRWDKSRFELVRAGAIAGDTFKNVPVSVDTDQKFILFLSEVKL